jgi:hypothetical protein
MLIARKLYQFIHLAGSLPALLPWAGGKERMRAHLRAGLRGSAQNARRTQT